MKSHNKLEQRRNQPVLQEPNLNMKRRTIIQVERLSEDKNVEPQITIKRPRNSFMSKHEPVYDETMYDEIIEFVVEDEQIDGEERFGDEYFDNCEDAEDLFWKWLFKLLPDNRK